MLMKSSQCFHVNSANRTAGTNSSFEYELKLDKNNEYTHCCVLDVSIPKSYYLVVDGRNSFDIVERDTKTQAVISTDTVTFDEGNYNLNSLMATLEAKFVGGLSEYSASFPNTNTQVQTGKLTFTRVNMVNDIEFEFKDDAFAQIFGFSRSSVNQFTNNGGTGTLISTSILDLQLESTLFIHSDLVDNINDSVLIEVFSSSNANLSNISYHVADVEAHSKKITHSGSNSYKFSLRDEFGQLVPLNGISLLITLLVYEKSNIDELTRKYIKYKTLLSQQNLKKFSVK